MPAHILPMLALASPLPARQEDYAFEYKWDGIRAICFWDGQSLRLESRSLRDVTFRYPELQALGAALASRSAILDGEVLALNARGRPDFGVLQHRMNLADDREVARLMKVHPVAYMIFDVLYLGGRSTLGLAYQDRRHLLEQLDLDADSWQTTPSHIGEGSRMLEIGRANGIEGVVAKRLGGLYEPGRRSGAWRKTKLLHRQEFVVGGWLPERGRRVAGALLLGYYTRPDHGRQELVYAGKTGTGFTEEAREMLTGLLTSRARSTSPFSTSDAPRGANWVEPETAVEVEFLGWTHHGTVRQGSYKGVRGDKDPHDVLREDQGGDT